MSPPRHPRLDPRAWQDTAPGELLPLATRHAVAPGGRPQPPLQEVLQGLDARELEGESVFDQLFGPLPAGDPRLPRR